MDVYHWPGCKCPEIDGCVATLGVFDGVHVGHQEILGRVRREADERGVPPVVITFDRHPHEVLDGPAQPCITSLDHRLRLFEDLAMRATVVVRFSREVAAMEAPEFARGLFRDLLGVEKLVLGFDARFGRNARGDIELCREMSDELGMSAEQVDPVRVDGEIVSSTGIREAVQEADLRRAEKLLGRPFSLLGTVVRGAGLGRKIGYPTANLDVHNELMPREGVYATWTRTDGGFHPSVTSVGSRETFPELTDQAAVVEVYLLDLRRNLYGEELEVQFKQWLRPQKGFDSAEELAEAITRDVERAAGVLENPPG
jgi:riboflavin kinase/FMN adenylyltransferase